ncbi:MAG: CAP domain-containing protein [Pyrinomonadaceae bacterium]
MSPNVRSYVFARNLRVSLITFLFLLSGLFVSQASAQVRSTAVMFAFVGVKLPMPTPATTNYAHPMARLVGTSERAALPRPFRPRLVLLETNHSVAPAPAAPVSAAPVPAMSAASALETRALELINAERAKKGLKPLVLDSLLLQAARMHSQSMATKGFFNHVSPDGKTANERLKVLGLHGWKAMGENIAYNQGYDDPVAFAVEKWMESPLHRQNMLSPMWTSSAIGIATAADGRIFFTELFLAR